MTLPSCWLIYPRFNPNTWFSADSEICRSLHRSFLSPRQTLNSVQSHFHLCCSCSHFNLPERYWFPSTDQNSFLFFWCWDISSEFSFIFFSRLLMEYLVRAIQMLFYEDPVSDCSCRCCFLLVYSLLSPLPSVPSSLYHSLPCSNPLWHRTKLWPYCGSQWDIKFIWHDFYKCIVL